VRHGAATNPTLLDSNPFSEAEVKSGGSSWQTAATSTTTAATTTFSDNVDDRFDCCTGKKYSREMHLLFRS